MNEETVALSHLSNLSTSTVREITLCIEISLCVALPVVILTEVAYSIFP